MKNNERKNITDIVYAFREINKDIKNAFDVMCNKLKSEKDFEVWKKWEKSIRPSVEGYRDFTDFLTDTEDNWYYLNFYGKYNKNVVGFTFVISIDYDENTDKRYSDFINKLDQAINKNTPMLCILGTYTLLDDTNDIKMLLDDYVYADEILQLSKEWKNYDSAKIAYNQWINVETNYEVEGKLVEKYQGWYKKASVKIVNITEIGSKEFAHNIVDELIKKC